MNSQNITKEAVADTVARVRQLKRRVSPAVHPGLTHASTNCRPCTENWPPARSHSPRKPTPPCTSSPSWPSLNGPASPPLQPPR